MKTISFNPAIIFSEEQKWLLILKNLKSNQLRLQKVTKSKDFQFQHQAIGLLEGMQKLLTDYKNY